MMQKQISSSGKRSFFSKKFVGPQVREKFTFEDMLCFQKVIICLFSREYFCRQNSGTSKLEAFIIYRIRFQHHCLKSIVT